MPLFSIITITYNNLDGLERTGKSLTLQTCDNYEWIIVDGASTDGTSDYLKTAPATIISEPDAGIYDAMNKGLASATGEYVIFMNAGDTFAAADILEMVEDQTESKPDFIYGDALEADPYHAVRYKRARPYTKTIWGMFTHHQAMLYKHDRIGDMRFNTDYKIAADYDFTLRFLKQARRVAYCPFPICIFESGGLSQTNTKTGRDEQLEIKKHHYSPLTCHGIAWAQKLSLALKENAAPLYWLLKR